MFQSVMRAPFLGQGIVAFMRKVEREEVVADVQVGSNNKVVPTNEVVRRSPPTNEVEAVDVEGLCFRQEVHADRRKVDIDPQRKTSCT